MNVKDLIKLLEKLPEDMVIVTAGDDEGNNFRLVPNGWCTVESFDNNMDIINESDYDEYDEDELTKYVCIG